LNSSFNLAKAVRATRTRCAGHVAGIGDETKIQEKFILENLKGRGIHDRLEDNVNIAHGEICYGDVNWVEHTAMAGFCDNGYEPSSFMTGNLLNN
jgi:hypothetical protein